MYRIVRITLRLGSVHTIPEREVLQPETGDRDRPRTGTRILARIQRYGSNVEAGAMYRSEDAPRRGVGPRGEGSEAEGRPDGAAALVAVPELK